MAKPQTNPARSVKDRLLNISRTENRAFDVLLVRFALERLLYRLSISEHRQRFVLKGGMLVTVWIDDDNRVTRDADFLGHGDADPDKLLNDFRSIMEIEADDGLIFDVDALSTTPIREELEYGGIRLKTDAYLEKTRIRVIVDIGFGDAMADATHQLDQKFADLFPRDFSAALRTDARVRGAHGRLDASMEAFRQTMTVQSQVVENIHDDAQALSEIVARSQGAEGSLQAQQATNQLLALTAKQQFQLQHMLAAQFRSESLERARAATQAAEARAATKKFLGTGSAYTPE